VVGRGLRGISFNNEQAGRGHRFPISGSLTAAPGVHHERRFPLIWRHDRLFAIAAEFMAEIRG
jgi:hypothetical protein